MLRENIRFLKELGKIYGGIGNNGHSGYGPGVTSEEVNEAMGNGSFIKMEPKYPPTPEDIKTKKEGLGT